MTETAVGREAALGTHVCGDGREVGLGSQSGCALRGCFLRDESLDLCSVMIVQTVQLVQLLGE